MTALQITRHAEAALAAVLGCTSCVIYEHFIVVDVAEVSCQLQPLQVCKEACSSFSIPHCVISDRVVTIVS
jgi:hypothetical protein